MKSGNLNLLEPSGPLQACKGTALPFNFFNLLHKSCINITLEKETERERETTYILAKLLR